MNRCIRHDRALSLCAAFLLLLLSLPALAGEIEDRLHSLMREYDTVGLAVVVVRDNGIVYRNSLGWKDRDAKIPLEQDDLFRIASISKSFAAVSILQLVEQGRLSLDDDASTLVGFPVRNPAFPDTPITLRMLLNHTSSITDAQKYKSLDVINPDTNANWRGSYAGRAPGETYEYSNLGYNMIGTIVERMSGQRYDAYVKQHVLDRLGLRAGYLPEALDANRFAQIYLWNGERQAYLRSEAAYAPLGKRLDGYRPGYDTPMFSPTGGLKISAPDLATWMLLHMNRGEWNGVRLLSAEHSALMQTRSTRSDENGDYGMAIRLDRALIPGVEMIGHTGSAYGLFSSMYFNPEKKYGFVVITNGARDVRLRTEVNRALYQHFIVDAAPPAQASN